MKKILSVFLIAMLAITAVMPALAIDVELPLVTEPTTFTIMVKKEDMSQNTWPEKAPVQFTEEQTGIPIRDDITVVATTLECTRIMVYKTNHTTDTCACCADKVTVISTVSEFRS